MQTQSRYRRRPWLIPSLRGSTAVRGRGVLQNVDPLGESGADQGYHFEKGGHARHAFGDLRGVEKSFT